MSPDDVEVTTDPGQEAVPEGEPAGKKTRSTRKAVPAAQKGQKKSATIDELLSAIKNMTVLELSELVKALEAEFGISAAAPVAAVGAAPAESCRPAPL